jgi:hypothetical protein
MDVQISTPSTTVNQDSLKNNNYKPLNLAMPSKGNETKDAK